MKNNSFGSKIKLVSLFAIPIIVLFFQSSCSDKEDNNNPDTSLKKPKIEITSPDTNMQVQCYISQEILVNLTAESNPVSGKALSSLQISFKFEDEDEVILLDSAISGNQFSLNNYPLTAYSSTGDEIWTFRVTDADGQYSETHLEFEISDSPPPSIAFIGGIYQPLNIPYTTGDATFEVGSQFVFGIVANTQSDKDLRRIFVERVYENVATLTILDSAFSSFAYTITIICFTYPTPGSEDFTITVWDKNDKSASVGFTITTEAADPELSTFTNIVLGSYDPTSPNGCFAAVTGETFSIPDAANNPEKIDWIYFDGSTYGHTIMAPDNDVILGEFATVADWTIRNATRFVRTNIDVATFDIIQDKNTLIAVISPYISTLNESYISELMPPPGEGLNPGDIYAFKTASDELLGLIKIKEVNQGASNGLSTIKYDVKIQE